MGKIFHLGTKVLFQCKKLFGLCSVGVRIMVINERNEILLVEHTYLPGWHLPGGGIRKNETPLDAAIREVYEETGVIVKETPQLFSVYHHKYRDVDDYPVLYMVRKFEQHKVSSPEIKRIAWFHYQNLPEDATQATQRRVDEVLLSNSISASW